MGASRGIDAVCERLIRSVYRRVSLQDPGKEP